MTRRISLAGLLALTALVAFSALAMAGPNTKGVIFQDVADGSAEPRDTVSNSSGTYGHVNSNQDANLNLRVQAALKGAAPNQEYIWIVYCGSTHATAWASLASGTVTTNPAGNANTGAIHIPADDLAACVGSDGTGHIDFDQPFPGTGTYVGSPIPYEIP